MKKLEFESNGSKWLLLCANNREDYYLNKRVIDNPNGRVGNGVSICMITEEQASEVVEYDNELNYYLCGEHPYINNGNGTKSILVGNTCPIKALHSLLKSKGVYLYENPYGNYKNFQGKIDDYQDLLKAESKTFYNPILFKILS